MPAWIVYGDAFGIVSRLAADGEPMRVEWLSGSAENVPPVATLLIPIAPVIRRALCREEKAWAGDRSDSDRVARSSRLVLARRLRQSVDEFAVSRERSEEHTSELQTLMRISYAVFCLKKKTK